MIEITQSCLYVAPLVIVKLHGTKRGIKHSSSFLSKFKIVTNVWTWILESVLMRKANNFSIDGKEFVRSFEGESDIHGDGEKLRTLVFYQPRPPTLQSASG